jgi:hypothetical protein
MSRVAAKTSFRTRSEKKHDGARAAQKKSGQGRLCRSDFFAGTAQRGESKLALRAEPRPGAMRGIKTAPRWGGGTSLLGGGGTKVSPDPLPRNSPLHVGGSYPPLATRIKRARPPLATRIKRARPPPGNLLKQAKYPTCKAAQSK